VSANEDVAESHGAVDDEVPESAECGGIVWDAYCDTFVSNEGRGRACIMSTVEKAGAPSGNDFGRENRECGACRRQTTRFCRTVDMSVSSLCTQEETRQTPSSGPMGTLIPERVLKGRPRGVKPRNTNRYVQ